MSSKPAKDEGVDFGLPGVGMMGPAPWKRRADWDPKDPFKAITRFYDDRIVAKGHGSIFDAKAK